jgi:hypothetical protein
MAASSGGVFALATVLLTDRPLPGGGCLHHTIHTRATSKSLSKTNISSSSSRFYSSYSLLSHPSFFVFLLHPNNHWGPPIYFIHQPLLPLPTPLSLPTLLSAPPRAPRSSSSSPAPPAPSSPLPLLLPPQRPSLSPLCSAPCSYAAPARVRPCHRRWRGGPRRRA